MCSSWEEPIENNIVVAITDIFMSLIHPVYCSTFREKINYLKWLYIQQLIQHNGVLKKGMVKINTYSCPENDDGMHVHIFTISKINNQILSVYGTFKFVSSKS